VTEEDTAYVVIVWSTGQPITAAAALFPSLTISEIGKSLGHFMAKYLPRSYKRKWPNDTERQNACRIALEQFVCRRTLEAA
jgi:hypothetical protein